MIIKKRIEKDIKCPGCKRIEVKLHAKGLCNACYHRERRHAIVASRKGVDNSAKTVNLAP